MAVWCTGWERTYVLSQPVHQTATYRCDDTRGCVMQFWPPDDEHMLSKHVEARNKLIVKQKLCASSWLITEINVEFYSKNNFEKLVNLFGFNIRICEEARSSSINKMFMEECRNNTLAEWTLEILCKRFWNINRNGNVQFANTHEKIEEFCFGTIIVKVNCCIILLQNAKCP